PCRPRPRIADVSHRWLGVLVLAAIVVGHAGVVGAPPPAPAAPGLDTLTSQERAVVERILERWRAMPPEERQRVLDNYRQWRSLSPHERKSARENLQRFRAL